MSPTDTGTVDGDYTLKGPYDRSVSPSAESDIASSSASSPRETVEHEFAEPHGTNQTRSQSSSGLRRDGERVFVSAFTSVHDSMHEIEQGRVRQPSTPLSTPSSPPPTLASASSSSCSHSTNRWVGLPSKNTTGITSNITQLTVAPRTDLSLHSPSLRPLQPLLLPASQNAITSSQLDLAKNLVLDILGWGVPPEVLLDSGLSPHAVLRIFTDLNLRLPANLVVSDEVWKRAGEWAPLPPDSCAETSGSRSNGGGLETIGRARMGSGIANSS